MKQHSTLRSAPDYTLENTMNSVLLAVITEHDKDGPEMAINR